MLLGDSGTGLTHLLIALGTAAAEAGRRVRYITTAALVNELAEAADSKQLSRVVGRYSRLDLLCLDEIGYVHLDPHGAELLFQIITAREERASIACASNAPFSEWATRSPTLAWPRPSSTGSPSTPTSSTPAPTPTACAPPEPPGRAPPYDQPDPPEQTDRLSPARSSHQPTRVGPNQTRRIPAVVATRWLLVG